MTPRETKYLKAVPHVVHDYANFVSSALMVKTGKHRGRALDPPVNTHVYHAFLLNCRKMADFFGMGRYSDDVNATHFAHDFVHVLPTCKVWKDALDKQLAHITYARVKKPRSIPNHVKLRMVREIKRTWKHFRRRIKGTVFESAFDAEITAKEASEFRGLDLR